MSRPVKASRVTLRMRFQQRDSAFRELCLDWIDSVRQKLDDVAPFIHELNEDWWLDPTTGKRVKRNVGECLMLIVTELAEAMEGYRRSAPDQHLPNRTMLEVELADALIRICDLAAGLGLDLAGAVAEKLKYNLTRPDHDLENRAKKGGKKV